MISALGHTSGSGAASRGARRRQWRQGQYLLRCRRPKPSTSSLLPDFLVAGGVSEAVPSTRGEKRKLFSPSCAPTAWAAG